MTMTSENEADLSNSSKFGSSWNLCDNDSIVLNLSNYTMSEVKWFFYPDIDYILIGHVMPFILTFGLVGNALFIYVIMRVKSMRTITNIYLINLAIADSCYITFGILDKMAGIRSSPVLLDMHALGVTWCITVFPFVRMCAFASLFLVTLVTFDKYYAICKPLQHHLRTSPGRSHTKYVILLAWFFAFCIAVFTIPNSSRIVSVCVLYPTQSQQTYPEVVSYCNPMKKWMPTAVHGVQTLPFFVALFPNIFMYCQIVRRLHNRKLVGSNIPPLVRNRLKLRNTVAKMLVFNGTIFFLCNMPFHTTSLIYMLSHYFNDASKNAWEIKLQPVQPIIHLLMYINSASNPYIYHSVNRSYRKCLYQAIFCSKPRKSVSMIRSTIIPGTLVPNVNLTEAISDDTHL
ncbi:Growth hormone secretagogue receptor type 1 [Holothuria leucospilota]|uniref:Growth hormone secretagogue receptor type 1 n=1 Tax=Holothuria leucospilota TaxID=206669 RepID=A0A9Q1CHT5_HOLLE|nr:Growth hormone secretagogue receptor type 1 [Holothuria leucospilota]